MLPDTVMFENIICAIDGVHCVYQLHSILGISELQLKACLAFLHEVDAVSFIDMFDICNIYVLENFEAIWDESLLTELVDYSRIHVVSQTSSHFMTKVDQITDAAAVKIEFDDVRILLSLFHGNISLAQIMQHMIFAKMKNLIDIHRFVVFCCIHKILRRVYVYPTITNDSTAFFALFGNTLTFYNNPGFSMVEETVGMSVDPLTTTGTKRYEDEDSLALESKHTQVRHLYHNLYSSFQYSLYHSSVDRGGLSRHSSCLSFHKEMMTTNPCTCQLQGSLIRSLLERHQCLEYISLHSNCCVPAVMRYLETVDNVVFLKVYNVSFNISIRLKSVLYTIVNYHSETSILFYKSIVKYLLKGVMNSLRFV